MKHEITQISKANLGLPICNEIAKRLGERELKIINNPDG